ncbi:hypothetical protein ERC79_00775 [Rhodococcus sp. ABRD24]|uniref:hypothetical protein n=1 Tax=Rhodococcus sp. ABRD24 TaxID=2507582 RepID=UPI00103D16EB|nr:hypothetical protein ERC79_00775 [Rhodococcus sp. ABRD24]
MGPPPRRGLHGARAGHVTRHRHDGLHVQLRKSKTDQDGSGITRAMPYDDTHPLPPRRPRTKTAATVPTPPPEPPQLSSDHYHRALAARRDAVDALADVANVLDDFEARADALLEQTLTMNDNWTTAKPQLPHPSSYPRTLGASDTSPCADHF